MNKKELEALAREIAKTPKTEKDLNEFSQMLTKITVEAALNAEHDEHRAVTLQSKSSELIVLETPSKAILFSPLYSAESGTPFAGFTSGFDLQEFAGTITSKSLSARGSKHADQQKEPVERSPDHRLPWQHNFPGPPVFPQ